MTAEELVQGLRERGYVIHRSSGPGWVIIPRLKPDDPIAAWLGRRGAFLRSFHPEFWTNPSLREYEASIISVRVSDDFPQQAIWEAARP
jgi:hypothetical protein